METVKVKCQVTQENPQGFYLVNAEDVAEGMEVISDAPAPESTTTSEPESGNPRQKK
jgi:hypothetical protein